MRSGWPIVCSCSDDAREPSWSRSRRSPSALICMDGRAGWRPDHWWRRPPAPSWSGTGEAPCGGPRRDRRTSTRKRSGERATRSRAARWLPRRAHEPAETSIRRWPGSGADAARSSPSRAQRTSSRGRRAMEPKEVLDEVRTILVTRLKFDPQRAADVVMETPLPKGVDGALGLDSLDFIELGIAIEERFGIVMDESEDLAEHFMSLDTLCRFVAARATVT